MATTSTDGDLLRGAPAIADHLNLPVRMTYHLLAKGQLPGFHLGGKWCARPRRLAEHFMDLEAAEAEKRQAVQEKLEAAT